MADQDTQDTQAQPQETYGSLAFKNLAPLMQLIQQSMVGNPQRPQISPGGGQVPLNIGLDAGQAVANSIANTPLGKDPMQPALQSVAKSVLTKYLTPHAEQMTTQPGGLQILAKHAYGPIMNAGSPEGDMALNSQSGLTGPGQANGQYLGAPTPQTQGQSQPDQSGNNPQTQQVLQQILAMAKAQNPDQGGIGGFLGNMKSNFDALTGITGQKAQALANMANAAQGIQTTANMDPVGNNPNWMGRLTPEQMGQQQLTKMGIASGFLQEPFKDMLAGNELTNLYNNHLLNPTATSQQAVLSKIQEITGQKPDDLAKNLGIAQGLKSMQSKLSGKGQYEPQVLRQMVQQAWQKSVAGSQRANAVMGSMNQNLGNKFGSTDEAVKSGTKVGDTVIINGRSMRRTL